MKELRVNENSEVCKQCVGECKEWLPLHNFPKSGYSTNGTLKYKNECKVCRNARDRTTQRLCKRIERTIDDNGKECQKCSGECGKIKIISEFELYHSKGKLRYHGECKECRRTKRQTPESKLKHKQAVSKFMSRPDKTEITTRYTQKCLAKPGRREAKQQYDRAYHNDPIRSANAAVRKKEMRKLYPEKFRISDAKHHYTQRAKGCELINECFDDGEIHHLWTDEFGHHDHKTAVCTPNIIHKQVKHCGDANTKFSIKPGHGMVKITELILIWYEKECPNDDININKLRKIRDATKRRVECGWENAHGWREYQEYKKSILKSNIEMDD